MPHTAFSYSRLNNFEQCPKKFHAISIAKSYKEAESEQMLYGSAVHKSLELRLARNAPLPSHLQKLEPVMAKLAGTQGYVRTEFQMAINAAYRPVGWFDRDVYCRAIADVAINNGSKGVVVDYKTGMISDDFTQLELVGDMFFLHESQVEELTLAFLWTKSMKLSKTHITRDGMAQRWANLMPRINRYQTAFQQQEFPPRPGGHCRWCPVESCPHFMSKRA